jgi:hypothetical protein
MGCNLHRTIVRREGEIICKTAGEYWRVSWSELGVGWAFIGTNPARSLASSCQLRSGVSPVPKSEGPGAPSVWFLGRRTKATRLLGAEPGVLPLWGIKGLAQERED